MKLIDISGYRYSSAAQNNAHGFLLPAIVRILDSLNPITGEHRLFELGCGNGSVANSLTFRGWDVTGVDPSIEGIEQAHIAYPNLRLEIGSGYDDLVKRYGQFPIVLSLEVIEHIYAPRQYVKSVFDLLCPGGTSIFSTPYHGYWKNLALALSGRMDRHFTALWDHGHIKFWSMETLRALLEETGFVNVMFKRVGRVPLCAKAMIAIAQKPGDICEPVR